MQGRNKAPCGLQRLPSDKHALMLPAGPMVPGQTQPLGRHWGPRMLPEPGYTQQKAAEPGASCQGEHSDTL